MSSYAAALDEVTELLQNAKSLKRKIGAKKARNLVSLRAGDILVQALNKEITDWRTWSVQYELIISLGITKSYQSLPLLRELVKQDFKATIIYQALGNALMRLTYKKQGISHALEIMRKTENVLVLNGAFRAVATLKLVPKDDTIKMIIQLARDAKVTEILYSYPGDKTGLRYWVAVACAGWKTELVMAFLNECLLIKDSSLQLAAKSSMSKKYLNYKY